LEDDESTGWIDGAEPTGWIDGAELTGWIDGAGSVDRIEAVDGRVGRSSVVRTVRT